MTVDLVSTITTTFAFAAAAGGGASIFYASRSRNIITLLKDENAALVGSNTRLERENEVLNTKLTAMETERNIWRDNVTQAPAINALITSTTSQHNEVIGKIGTLIDELRQERVKK